VTSRTNGLNFHRFGNLRERDSRSAPRTENHDGGGSIPTCLGQPHGMSSALMTCSRCAAQRSRASRFSRSGPGKGARGRVRGDRSCSRRRGKQIGTIAGAGDGLLDERHRQGRQRYAGHLLVLAPTAGLRPHGTRCRQVKLCFGHAGDLANALASYKGKAQDGGDRLAHRSIIQTVPEGTDLFVGKYPLTWALDRARPHRLVLDRNE